MTEKTKLITSDTNHLTPSMVALVHVVNAVAAAFDVEQGQHHDRAVLKITPDLGKALDNLGAYPEALRTEPLVKDSILGQMQEIARAAQKAAPTLYAGQRSIPHAGQPELLDALITFGQSVQNKSSEGMTQMRADINAIDRLKDLQRIPALDPSLSSRAGLGGLVLKPPFAAPQS